MRLALHHYFQIHWFVNYLFRFTIIVQKNRTLQIVSYERPCKETKAWMPDNADVGLKNGQGTPWQSLVLLHSIELC